jgi:hypothetical protein
MIQRKVDFDVTTYRVEAEQTVLTLILFRIGQL